MKIKDNIKRSFTLGLAILVSTQSLYADPLTNAVNSVQNYAKEMISHSTLNVTEATKTVEYDDNNKVKRRSASTPSVYFRFGTDMSYPEPIWNVSPPGISAGCGGLSIKGMFGSIIGLDRLEQMLKNAGASFAWGIAVGLIYSLPGVAAAFKMINNWAKKIQQLLANACQSGIKYAKEHITGGNRLKLPSYLDLNKGVEHLDNEAKTLLGKFDLGDIHGDNTTIGNSNSGKEDIETVKDNYKNLIQKLFLAQSLSTNLINGIIDQVADKKDKLKLIKKLLGVDTGEKLEQFKVYYFNISMEGKSTISGSNNVAVSDILSLVGDTSLDYYVDISQAFYSLAVTRHISNFYTLTSNKKTISTLVGDIKGILEAKQASVSTTKKDSDKKDSDKKDSDKKDSDKKDSDKKDSDTEEKKLDREQKELNKILTDTANNPMLSFGSSSEINDNTYNFAKEMANNILYGNNKGIEKTSDINTFLSEEKVLSNTLSQNIKSIKENASLSDEDKKSQIDSAYDTFDTEIAKKVAGIQLTTEISNRQFTKINNIYMGAVVLPASKSDTADPANSIIIFFSTKSSGNGDFFGETFNDGLVLKSKKLIKTLVASSGGTKKSIIENFKSQGVLLLIPGILDKIKIIQQSLTNERGHLIDILSKFNAYHMGEAIFASFNKNNSLFRSGNAAYLNLGGEIRKAKRVSAEFKDRDSAFIMTTEKNRKAYNKYAENGRKALKKESRIEALSSYELGKIFKEQDLKNRKRSLKSN